MNTLQNVGVAITWKQFIIRIGKFTLIYFLLRIVQDFSVASVLMQL